MDELRRIHREERARDHRVSIPSWAASEHMEKNTPQTVLWRYLTGSTGFLKSFGK